MNSNPRMKTLVTVTLLVTLYTGVAGNREGNGGDHVRGTYLRMGQAVIDYLSKTQQGADLAAVKGLDVPKLKDTLTIDKVAVYEGELKDNGGSDVDAIGVPGKVTLRKDIWMEHFEKERDVYYLVFHEMLRSAGYNDDNYVYSQPLYPFPRTLRVSTRINPLLPLVDGDSMETMVSPDQVGVNGTGCSVREAGTYVDLDLEKNVLEVTLDRYGMIAAPSTALADGRKSCAVAMPLTIPPGKRVVISQLDIAGKVNLPTGSSAQVNLEAFSAGLTGPKVKKLVSADVHPQVGRIQMRLTNFYATGCGGFPILRLNTSGSVNTLQGDTARLKIDRVALYFKVEDCSR